MKCSLGISNFLEEISSLFHSIVFLYFFALILYFLSLLAILWNSAFKRIYLYFFPLPFTSLLFTAICKSSSDNHFAFLHFFFLGMVLICASCTMSRNSVHSSSGTLSDLIPWIYLSLPLYNNNRWYLLSAHCVPCIYMHFKCIIHFLCNCAKDMLDIDF